jgi:hypothetical protein
MAPTSAGSTSAGSTPALTPGAVVLTLVVANAQSSGVDPIVTGGSPNVRLHPRYYEIAAEDRNYAIAAENRRYTV